MLHHPLTTLAAPSSLNDALATVAVIVGMPVRRDQANTKPEAWMLQVTSIASVPPSYEDNMCRAANCLADEIGRNS